MKKILLTIFCVIFLFLAYGEEFSTNRNPVGLEYNILFHADKRYTVTQTGAAQLYLPMMFDGNMNPSYPTVSPTLADPTVIEVSGLPEAHTQTGAWVGWTTRWWNSNHFKIEGYNIYQDANSWVVLADYSVTTYSGYDFAAKMPSGVFTKIRYTFYSATGTNGRIGISELFFIHPEATTPYRELIENQGFRLSGDNKIITTSGNVGIGTSTPANKLEVVGTGCFLVPNATTDIGGAVTSYGLTVSNNFDSTLAFRMLGKGIAHITTDSIGREIRMGGGLFEQSVVIKAGGNVGIGTMNPDYKLTVNGAIHATEIIVTSSIADYVFKPDYKLKTLDEVKAFIRQNGHLPDVPNEEQVSVEGVSLGDMNRILIQKLEEMTLYLLEQEERIQELEKKLDQK